MLNKINQFRGLVQWLQGVRGRADTYDMPVRSSHKHTKVLVGNMLSRLNAERRAKALRDVEFQVFSQFGDDGIIQYLIQNLPIEERSFVEFGVEDYTESNTRFLLVNDKWSGLVLDGDQNNVDYINRDLVSLFYDVRPRQAFITAENIDQLLLSNGFEGRIGLLSVDIDGVDYWVWQAITAVEPAIVIAEYNASFGPDRAISVPYRADFQREKAHPSRLYWGASLAALQHLAKSKGYAFIGCNANGNNAYFVRESYADLPCIKDLDRGFVAASFSEYSIQGLRVRGPEVFKVIEGLPVVNVLTGQIEPL